MTRPQKRIISLVFFLFTFIVATLPLFKLNYFFKVDDFFFHYGRMENYYQAVCRGNLFPKVFPSMANGSGYGVDIFYPSISLLPYVLFRYFFSPFLAYKLFLFTIYLGTAGTTFLFSHRVFSNYWIQQLFAFFYLLNPYFFINIYLRGAIGEALAMMIFPLCFLGVWEIFQGNNKRWWILGVGMSLLITVHLLSTLIFSFFLGLLFFWEFLSHKQDRKSYFFGLFKSAILAFFLSFWQLISMFEQTSTQKFAVSLKHFYPNYAPNLLKFFQNSFRFNYVLHKPEAYSFLFFPLALVLLLSLFIKRKNSFSMKIMVLALLMSFLMIQPISTFIFNQTPLKFFQFSFRLSGLTNFLFTYTLFALYDSKTNISNHALKFASLVLLSGFVLLTSLISSLSFQPTYYKKADITHVNQNIEVLGKGFEYIKAWESPGQHIIGLDLTNYLNKQRKELQIKELSRKYDTTKIMVNSSTYTLFETDLNYYKGYVVKSKESPFSQIPTIETRGRVAFVLSPGINHLTIRYEKTFLQKISLFISGLTWLLFMPGIYWLRKKGRKNPDLFYFP